jgi:hypothetical protein
VDMPTQFPHTFFHPDQPQPAPAFLLRIETHAVVLDGDGNEADAAVKAEANLAGCRVPGAIRQRFLDNPVDAGPMGIRENVGIPITIANAASMSSAGASRRFLASWSYSFWSANNEDAKNTLIAAACRASAFFSNRHY